MKRGMSFIIVLLTMLCLTGYAFASDSSRLNGKPDAFDPGHSNGYFIWQDGKGLHLRATTAGPEHVFSGTISTDGTFEDVFGKSQGADDGFHVNGDRDKITFKFTTSGREDGIDLHVSAGSYVGFKLSMDGEDIDPASIFIGSDGWHPGSYKFTLRHDGDPEKYKDDRTVIIVDGFYWWDFPGYWGPGWYGPRYGGYWGHGGYGHRNRW
jgi:hypothetical protein